MRRPGIHLFARGQNGGEQHAAAAKRMGSLSSYRFVRREVPQSNALPIDAPPSINSVWPVMKTASSDSRNWIAAAISSGVPPRCMEAPAGYRSSPSLPAGIAGAEQFCFGRAGRHSVDRNASSREFECPGPGGAHQSRLCSRIGGPLVDAKTGIIDDTSPIVRPHPRQRRLRGLNGGLQVKAKDRIECLQFDIGKGLRNPQT